VLVGTFARMSLGDRLPQRRQPSRGPDLEHRVTQPALVAASRADGQVRWDHAEQLSRNIATSTIWASPSLSHLIWFGSGGPATDQRTEDLLTSL
jgi:hypothetical protein